MGIFSDHMRAVYNGSLIEIEVKSINDDKIFTNLIRSSLIIQNDIVDEKDSYLGKVILRGFIENNNGIRDQVQVIIDQGFFRTKYILKVNGINVNLQKIH